MFTVVWCTLKDWHAQSLKLKLRSRTVKLIHLAVFKEVLVGSYFHIAIFISTTLCIDYINFLTLSLVWKDRVIKHKTFCFGIQSSWSLSSWIVDVYLLGRYTVLFVSQPQSPVSEIYKLIEVCHVSLLSYPTFWSEVTTKIRCRVHIHSIDQ